MKIKIEKGTAKGRIKAPSSKSMAHRLLICAAMCDGVSTVRDISMCEDVRATIDCLRALGIRIEENESEVRVYGKSFSNLKPTGTLLCRESGSTLRFFIPIALICGKTVMFNGEGTLMKRPLDVYEELCRDNGMTFIADGNTITVKGPLTGGEFSVVGNISSQFISGLLFALPSAERDSTIKIAPPIESRSYIDLTLEALKLFGIKAEWKNEYTIFIPGNQRPIARDVTVEGDYSGAAFIDSLNIFDADVSVDGLREDSIQGDKAYRRYFDMLSRGVPTINIGDCPDLGPILFAISAAKNGGIFDGTRRLKIKESDRASAMAEELKKFGARVSVYDDTVVVYPADFHKPSAILEGHGDHRIVMSLAVLCTLVGGEINGAEAVSKSYPEFFEHLSSLGIKVIKNEA